MPKPLTSDELGEKGENLFAEKCADAKLICNRSTRDYAGWDFIVDFPLDGDDSSPFDNPLSPLSCRVQLKTIWNTSKKVELKLNMASRLAKDAKPTFVCILKINEDLSVEKCYLLHFLGGRLGQVLRRLRIERGKGTRLENLNKTTISFAPERDEEVEFSGRSIRHSMSEAIGGDLHAYLSQKRQELSNLGFDDNRFEGTMTLTADKGFKFSDFYLGLERNVQVKDFATVERRFGIGLPLAHHPSALISIDPVPHDTCAVTVSGRGSSKACRFDADLFMVPRRFNDGRGRMYLRSPLFTIDIDQRKRGGDEIKIKFDHGGRPYKLSEWKRFWRAVYFLGEGYSVIALKGLGRPEFSIDIPVDDRIDGAENVAEYLAICDALEEIFSHFDIDVDHTSTWDELFQQSEKIALFRKLLGVSQSEFIPLRPKSKYAREFRGGSVLIFNYIKFDKKVLAYSIKAVANFDNENEAFVISGLIFNSVSIIEKTEMALREHVDACMRSAGIDSKQAVFAFEPEVSQSRL